MTIEILNYIGNMTLEKPYRLIGIVTGQLDVRRGGELVLEGVCGRDLVVHPGGRAVLNGFVGGNVVNRGGEVDVSGRVAGQVLGLAGATRVHPEAVVGERDAAAVE